MIFDDRIPIYLQLVAMMEQEIASGNYPPKSKLPSRRDLAEKYQVNPNTVQRAFKEMEERGLIDTKGNQGSFVTEDPDKTYELKIHLLERATASYLDQVEAIGIDQADLKAYLSDYFDKKKEESDHAGN